MELLAHRKTSSRMIRQLISPLIRLFVTIDSIKGNIIINMFIVNLKYLLAKPMTQ